MQVVRLAGWPGRRPAALRRRRPSASRSRRADRTACSGAARGTIPSPTSPRRRGRAARRPPWPRRAGCPGAGAAARPQKPTATPASVPRCTRSRADGRAHEHEPQRHRGDEQRGQPGGHVALGDGHEAVAAGRQQQADEARGGEAAGRDAHAVPARGEEGEHGDAGDREARAGSQQRRDVLDHHADGDVGPAPQDVDDGRAPTTPSTREERGCGRRRVLRRERASRARGKRAHHGGGAAVALRARFTQGRGARLEQRHEGGGGDERVGDRALLVDRVGGADDRRRSRRRARRPCRARAESSAAR